MYKTAGFTGCFFCYLTKYVDKTLRQLLESYANGTDIFCIDCIPCFADSGGYLFRSVTGDCCHPTATHYKTWKVWMNRAMSALGI